MRSIRETFVRLVRKAHRETHLGIVAVAVSERPDGGLTADYAAEGVSPVDIMFAAEAVLDLVLKSDADPSCPCCVERLERATAALAALRAPEAEPVNSIH